MNSELVRYDSTTLAAGALHRDMVGPGREELRQICRALPPGAEAVVQFIAVADLDHSGQMYHAATAHFKISEGNRLTVTASIGAYETGHYQRRISQKEIETPAIEFLPPGTAVALASSPEIIVRRHPLISAQNAEDLISMRANERCPQAFLIMRAVNKMFQAGVPLPSDQRFHYCTFTVMVHLPRDRTQYLSVLRGVRGVFDPRAVSSAWATTSVCESEGDEKELERFQELQREACEGVRPSRIPPHARPISSGTKKTIAYTPDK